MDVTAGPIAIELDLVRALLAEQHPDLAALPVELLAEGWDNTVFRLGHDLTVRLPRRIEGAPLMASEQRWVPSLVAHLPSVEAGGLATSAPLRRGVPGCGFPWCWSIGAWLPGDIAARSPIDDPFDAARRLGEFLAAFHRTAPADAPDNPYRGVPLTDRAPMLVVGLDRIEALGRPLGPGVERTMIEARWAELSLAAPWTGPALWLHGDLHLGNLLVDRGRLSAVIDFGDLTSGDPATDLAVAWPLLPLAARSSFRDAAGRTTAWGPSGIDDASWQRAEAWALAFAVAYLAGSVTTSPLIGVARRALAAVLLG